MEINFAARLLAREKHVRALAFRSLEYCLLSTTPGTMIYIQQDTIQLRSKEVLLQHVKEACSEILRVLFVPDCGFNVI